MGGQCLLRELPLQESGRAHSRHRVGLRNAALRRGSAQNLLNKVQEGAAPIGMVASRVQAKCLSLRYVIAFSIGLELTGNDSAFGASKPGRFALSCQTAYASNASLRRWGAV